MLAFVASEAREFAGLLRHVEQAARLDWPLDFARTAWLNGVEIVLAANGPGPKLAARAAEVVKEHYVLEGMISMGFCGGLSFNLKPCDIFVGIGIAGLVHALSVPRSHSCERTHTGTLLSIDRVATTAQEKRELREKTQADAIDMEAGALAAQAAGWNIPCYVIKVVTDTASESFPLDFNRLRDPEGRFNRDKIIAAALSRPASRLPALLHLNKRSKLASEALGDFIASTRF